MAGHLSSSWALFGLLFGCFACSGKSERDHHEPTLPLVPGTCVNTDCSWPVAEMHEPAALVTCVPTEGQPVEVVWSQAASKVTCESGQCFASPTDIALGTNGDVWTTAQLLEIPLTYDAESVGMELRRSAPTGALEIERVTHTGESTARGSGMSVSSNGELDWLGPSVNNAGLSLLHYDRAGNEMSSSWLVEHATRSTTHFGPHGITVAYQYESAVEGSDFGEEPDSSVGVARFDAKGSKILWNQTFTHAGLPYGAIDLAGVGHGGEVKVILHRGSSWEDGGGSTLVHLASDGRVAWARELVDSPVGIVGFSPTDGSLRLAAWLFEDDAPPTKMEVEALDGDGNSEWRASFVSGNPIALTVSEVGEAWVYAQPFALGPAPEPNAFFSIDGSTCARHALELELGLSAGDGSWMNGLGFTPQSDNHVAFASSGRYGVLALP